MVKQPLNIFGQFGNPDFLKLFGFHVKRGEKVFIGEARENISSIILYERIVEELEIIESTIDSSFPGFLTFLLFGFNLIKFIAGDVALLDKDGTFNEYGSIFEVLIIIIETYIRIVSVFSD